MSAGMVERAAKALCATEEPTPWERLEESGGTIPTRDDFRNAARAAIAALREPTEAMIDAMRAATASRLALPDGVAGEREKYRLRWHAGCDAALAEDTP